MPWWPPGGCDSDLSGNRSAEFYLKPTAFAKLNGQWSGKHDANAAIAAKDAGGSLSCRAPWRGRGIGGEMTNLA